MSSPPIEDTVEASERVTGTIDHIQDGIAVVLVGPEQEPWDFPLEILPADVSMDSLLVLERVGRRLRFVELDPVTEVVRTRAFELRMQRTVRKLPYMADARDS
jgi:hypothetical protein